MIHFSIHLSSCLIPTCHNNDYQFHLPVCTYCLPIFNKSNLRMSIGSLQPLVFIYNESRNYLLCPNYLRFQGTLMHLLFENLRPRVVIYSKIDLSLSRPRWFWWMASNADLVRHPSLFTPPFWILSEDNWVEDRQRHVHELAHIYNVCKFVLDFQKHPKKNSRYNWEKISPFK